MQITIVPSASASDSDEQQYLSSYVVDDVLAVDAGSVGFGISLEKQRSIESLLLTHAHLDHLASMPVFLDNIGGRDPKLLIASLPEVLASLKEDLFNDRLWPSLLSGPKPIAKLVNLAAGEVVEIGPHRVTAIRVDHGVPALGYVISDEKSSVVFSGDTGPTEELWRQAKLAPNLKAVFLECSFPNALEDLARRSKHLTPSLWREELKKLDRPEVPIFAIHLKPAYRRQVIDELAKLDLMQVRVADVRGQYVF